MPRPRNSRRTVHAHMRLMHRLLKDMLAPWDIQLKVRVKDEDGKWGGLRPLREDEKPENQPQAWHDLAKQADWLREAAAELEAYAKAQEAQLPGDHHRRGEVTSCA